MFLFFFPLSLSLPPDSPLPPCLCLLAPFPRRVTTQQPASGAPDWWAACDGGGLSVGLVRALPVVSQLSAVREHPVCSGGTSRICLCLHYLPLQHLSKYQHLKDFLWLSVSAQPQQLPDKDLKGIKYPLNLGFLSSFASISSFLSFVFNQQNPSQQKRRRSSSQHHLLKTSWEYLMRDTTTSPLWICSVRISVCAALPDQAPTTLSVRV